MKITLGICVMLISANAFIFAQTQQLLVENPEFDRTIRQYLDFSVPTISCQELKDLRDHVILLDAREEEEYQMSRIPGAKHIGFKRFNEEVLQEIPKDAKVVVYCSIGYRSEKVGEKLQDLGYLDVSNLYGSIFEWVNQELPIVDQNGEETKKVHTYNRSWSRWVEDGKAEKEW